MAAGFVGAGVGAGTLAAVALGRGAACGIPSCVLLTGAGPGANVADSERTISLPHDGLSTLKSRLVKAPCLMLSVRPSGML